MKMLGKLEDFMSSVIHDVVYPSNNTSRLHQRFRENSGRFKKQTSDCRHLRELRTVLIQAVVELISEAPEADTRKISNTLNVSKFTVFKIRKE